MTIDDVMSLIDEAITQTKWAMRANFDAEPDEQTQWAHVEHKKDIARRGILALLDAEAWACQSVVHSSLVGVMTCDANGHPVTEYVKKHEAIAAIRARIDARKGGNDD